jgi:WhiB family redox-sensing transcriptional regulator
VVTMTTESPSPEGLTLWRFIHIKEENKRSGGREWMTNAECRNYPNHMFFPRDTFLAGGRKLTSEQAVRSRSLTRLAIAICFTCPVRQECLVTAVVNNEPAGIWGGHTTGYRRNKLRPRLVAASKRAYRASRDPVYTDWLHTTSIGLGRISATGDWAQ